MSWLQFLIGNADSVQEITQNIRDYLVYGVFTIGEHDHRDIWVSKFYFESSVSTVVIITIISQPFLRNIDT